MASSEFDPLAVARDLQAAGVQTAHAEVIVSAVTQATGRLVTESRFDAAIAELCRDMEVGFTEHTAALTELRRDMKVGFAKQAEAFAEAKAEIYRYLWVWGGLLVAVLSSLYMLAETWSRG